MRWLLRADTNATILTRFSASGSPSEHSCYNLHRGRIMLMTGKNRTLAVPLPLLTQACNTNLKNVHWKLLWFLKGVVYQALHFLLLKSDSAAGWLIPLQGWEQRHRLPLCFKPFYPFTWAVPREMTQYAQLTVSVSALNISLVYCYTHIETNIFLPSLRGYFLFTIYFNLYVSYKNDSLL